MPFALANVLSQYLHLRDEDIEDVTDDVLGAGKLDSMAFGLLARARGSGGLTNVSFLVVAVDGFDAEDVLDTLPDSAPVADVAGDSATETNFVCRRWRRIAPAEGAVRVV